MDHSMRTLINIVESFDKKSSVNFLKILHKLVQEKYPDMKFIEMPNDRVRSEDDLMYVIGGEFVDEDLDLIGVIIDDVNTGPYTGVLVNAIRITTEKLSELYPDKEKVLVISDDRNPEAWEHIANKLGYRLMHDDDFDDY